MDDIDLDRVMSDRFAKNEKLLRLVTGKLVDAFSSSSLSDEEKAKNKTTWRDTIEEYRFSICKLIQQKQNLNEEAKDLLATQATMRHVKRKRNPESSACHQGTRGAGQAESSQERGCRQLSELS